VKKSTKRALCAMVFLAILAWHHAGPSHCASAATACALPVALAAGAILPGLESRR